MELMAEGSVNMLATRLRAVGGGGGGGSGNLYLYRYWRINFLAGTRSGWPAALDEIDASSGGSTVDLSGKTYSREKRGGYGNLASLFDGNLATGWGTNATPPEWIQIDYGSDVAIDTFGLTANGSWFGSVAYGPESFEVLGSSDGSNFDLLTTVSGLPIWNLDERREFQL